MVYITTFHNSYNLDSSFCLLTLNFYAPINLFVRALDYKGKLIITYP